MAPLRMAVIGVGHLGKEHARILAQLPQVELVGLADVNAGQAQAVAQRCGCPAYTDYQALLPGVDAAVIAVPTTYHFGIARDFLTRRIPVLVEKPLAATRAHAEQLAELARRQQTTLQVGHIERFNPAFQELQRRPLQPRLIQAERLGPYTGRSTDIGVVLDLMIHDLDLLLALTRSPVCSVEAVGLSVFGNHEDVASARLVFANGCVATLTASRASVAPRRHMHIWGPEGHAALDFARRSVTLAQVAEPLPRRDCEPFRSGPLAHPPGGALQVRELDCDGGDQLTREVQHFIGCVQAGIAPLVSGDDGRDAVVLATRILECIREHSWEGAEGRLRGPSQLPAPLGSLLQPSGDQQAA
jgi:predicted dehydrogenase